MALAAAGTLLALASATIVGVGTAATAATPTPATSATPVAGAILPAPSGNAFYVPPNPLPPGRPGDVIWARRMSSIHGISHATGFQVMYRSTDALGQPDAVTGTILIPTGRNLSTMPIVGYAAGTQGLGDQCAPSRQLASGLEYEIIGINATLAKGYAVALTDYQGLGTPGDHTYVVGRAEGPAVIDSVRAAERLPAAGLGANHLVGFYGYSQGGGAAAWAGELQPQYAPELHLVGIAAGGVPADLIAVEKNLDGHVGAGFGYMAALGMSAAYPELNLPSFLNAKGAKALAKADTQCLFTITAEFAFTHISTYTTSNPLTTPAWVARLNQNKLGSMPPKVPILLYAGTHDEIVGFAQQETLAQTYCAAGADVTWKTYFGEHVSTLLAGESTALSFLGSRFAGQPVTAHCPS